MTDKFIVTDCQLDGHVWGVRRQPIAIRPGQQLEITGRLRSGTWPASGITTFWKVPAGERQTHVVRKGDHLSLILLHIYGDQPRANLGIVQSEMVEVRQLPKVLDEVEFRIRFAAPEKRGTYVVDLQAQEYHESPRRGQKLTKPVGHPVWRRELVVK